MSDEHYHAGRGSLDRYFFQKEWDECNSGWDVRYDKAPRLADQSLEWLIEMRAYCVAQCLCRPTDELHMNLTWKDWVWAFDYWIVFRTKEALTHVEQV